MNALKRAQREYEKGTISLREYTIARRSIRWIDSHPEARGVLPSHVKAAITASVDEDIAKAVRS